MPKKEDLSRVDRQVESILGQIQKPDGVTVKVRGAVQDMNQSFSSFGIGLILAVVLVYLILMAQFASFSDPFVILLAVPPGLSGVLIFLLMTGTTLNVMSLMGRCNDRRHRRIEQHSDRGVRGNAAERGHGAEARTSRSLQSALRPILMTTMATILGLIPMALALEPGSEQYAPLARAILGGLAASVLVTVFLVPTAYLLIHRKEESRLEGSEEEKMIR